MPRMTGGAALVQSLLSHGVNTLFALPGVQMDPFFNALHDAGEAIRVIHTRHEQGAAYMAFGYAAASGRPGVYAVVPGPGLLNTTTALCSAYAVNAKVLCLTGEIPSSQIGLGVGHLHELPDQLGLLRTLTKWSERIPGPEAVPETAAEAFRRMASGRPRPVALEMALDDIAREGEVNPVSPSPPEAPPQADPEALAEAGRILCQAVNPLIFVGSGALHAAGEVAALSQALQAPVITMRGGRGIMPPDDPYFHTLPGGNRLWAKADAVLGVGTRMFYPLRDWGLDDGLKIVRIDIDPTEPGRVAQPAVSIVADSQAALRDLLPQVEAHNHSRPSRRTEYSALKAEVQAEFEKLEPQMTWLRTLRAALPEEGVLVEDITQVTYVGWFAWPVYAPRTYITTGYQGTLGAGFATALGAKVARPDVPVLNVSGDGGFMYTVQELATAVQQGISVVSVVFNDNAFGNVRRMQRDLYGGRIIASELHNPDLVALAQSFGAQGLRADTPEELQAAIARGFETGGPTLIEVPLGETPAPWHQVHLPKVRGD